MTVPWFIGQPGAKHSAEIARVLAFAATGGAEGVIGTGHMKVLAQTVPNGSVRVTPGACSMLNRQSAGTLAAVYQSYVDGVSAQENLTIPATAGTARADLIVRIVQDSQYPPNTIPANPAVGPYGKYAVISNVEAARTTLVGLGLPYSAVVLARINIPASTAAITQAMITDLRQLSQPRTSSMRRTFMTSGAVTLTSGTPVRWPNVSQSLAIPSWATHAQIKADVAGIYVDGANATAALRVALGTSGQSMEVAVASVNIGRIATGVAHEFTLSATDRAAGTAVLDIKGYKGSGGSLYADHATPVTFDVMFEERAV